MSSRGAKAPWQSVSTTLRRVYPLSRTRRRISGRISAFRPYPLRSPGNYYTACPFRTRNCCIHISYLKINALLVSNTPSQLLLCHCEVSASTDCGNTLLSDHFSLLYFPEAMKISLSSSSFLRPSSLSSFSEPPAKYPRTSSIPST